MGKENGGLRLTSALLPTLLITGLILGGCASYSGFVYKPAPPITEKPRVPFSVVVMTFEDGTPEWKETAGIPGESNFAKGPMIWNSFSDAQKRHTSPPFIPPERWAREFSQELTASGVFPAVLFAADSRDPGGDILIRGKVLSATMSGFGFYDYSLELHAVRSDGKEFWKTTVSRQLRDMNTNPVDVTVALWRSMFGEAVADLVKELESRRSEWGAFLEEPAAAAPAASEAGESVEEILRKINKQ